MSIYVAPRPQKAVTGTGVGYVLSGAPMLSTLGNSPQARMRKAWQLGISVPWIRAAERVITGLGSTVPWHLEDADDTEIDDDYPNAFAQVARMLIEKPQQFLDTGQKLSRRELWALTLRHLGLCGNAFWLLDLPAPAGFPTAVIYLRPDRMTPKTDARGNLAYWVIDDDSRGNGIRVELPDLIQFVLEPPDEGFFAPGLVESALLKAELTGALDRHLLTVIESGGRQTGILAPKSGVIETDVYTQLVTDWRVASEGGDAARRLQIVRAPVDFTQTQMSPQDMMVRDLMTGSRDDLLGLWGVPITSLGLHDRGKGMGATAATTDDNPALWRNAVIPRLTAFREPLQFELLDRWQNVGVTVELEIETPEFDDDKPQFDKAQLAQSIPLVRNERRAIIGLEPLPDYGPDGEPLGLAIDLPATLVTVGQGPEADGGFSNAPKPEPDPVPPPLPLFGGPPPTEAPPAPPVPGKGRTNARAVRLQVERHTTPQIRRTLASFLAEQRKDIADRLRRHVEHVRSEPKDTDIWFPVQKWDRRLLDTLRPGIVRMAESVHGHLAAQYPGKAGPVEASARALQRGGTRVSGINDVTRRKIAEAISRAIEAGDDVLTVADAIETAGMVGGLDMGSLFSELRAETIARTELAAAYNGAAIGAYTDAGITRVQAIDGDNDPECAERDGQVYDADEADGIEDHPNGTLDWAPVLEAA